MRYNTIYPALWPVLVHADRQRRGRGDRGCVTVDHRPICGAAVPARRDWSRWRAIPMVPRPSFRVFPTCTTCVVDTCVRTAGGPLAASCEAGCRSPFHCCDPGTPGPRHPSVRAVRPLPRLLDLFLVDDRNSTSTRRENLSRPAEIFGGRL